MAQQQLFELLKRDHRQVEQFMDQLVEGDEDQRKELFDQLNESLSLHMQLEEKFFYPRIKNAPQLKEQVQDALEEHRETKEFLQKLSKMKFDSEQWLDTLEEMQEGVLHHVEDEEDQIFPQCRDVLNTPDKRHCHPDCGSEGVGRSYQDTPPHDRQASREAGPAIRNGA